MTAALLLALWLPGRAAAADLFQKAPSAIPGVGVLLLGEGGDEDWNAQVELIKKSLGSTPVEFAPGDADQDAIQHAVTALETGARKIKKIVAVPLYVSSFSDTLDEDRYVLGIREKPSQAIINAPHAIFGAPKRVRTKLPIVLTKALDDHQVFVDLLADRALKQTRDPSKDALLLVGLAPVSTTTTSEWLAGISALAEKVRAKGGFAAARAAAISEGESPERRDQSENALRKLVMNLRHQGRVIAVSLEPTAPFGHSAVAAALDGLFVAQSGKALFPDPAFGRWVYQSVVEGAELPDMRNYKDGAGGPFGRASFPPLGGD